MSFRYTTQKKTVQDGTLCQDGASYEYRRVKNDKIITVPPEYSFFNY